jgi:hypothetical protein
MIKVSRDLIFCEDEFINKQRIKSTKDIVKNDLTYWDHSEPETLIDQNEDSSDSTSVNSEQSDTASPVINEIVVQPPPELNRRQRRAIVKTTKGFIANIWPTNYKEALSMADAKQWKQAVQRELASLLKNQTWTIVPQPKDAKVVKSRRIKDNGLHKARFCAKDFTQRWGEDYDETFAPVAKYTYIRTLFTILAGRRNVKVHQMDANTAFYTATSPK